MVQLSLLSAVSLASLALAQQSQIPEIPAVTPTDANCGGCYVVADVLGIVFGSVSTATFFQTVSVGLNTTSTFSLPTTLVNSIGSTETQATFSFAPSGLIPGPPAPTQFQPLDSTIQIGGAILTSPTQYNLISAYTITSFTPDVAGGSCATVVSPITLSTAASFAVPEDVPADYLLEVENSFIGQVGLTCSGVGGAVTTIVQSMVDSTTETTTTSNTIRPTPSAISTTSTPSSTSTTITSTTSITFNATLVLPTATAPIFTFSPTPSSIMIGAAVNVAPGILSAAAVAIGLAAVLL